MPIVDQTRASTRKAAGNVGQRTWGFNMRSRTFVFALSSLAMALAWMLPGLAGAQINEFPFAVKKLLMKPGKIFKFSAEGLQWDFTSPSNNGAYLQVYNSVFGGSFVHDFPPGSGWGGLRTAKYKDDVCKLSIKIIDDQLPLHFALKVTCKATGTLEVQNPTLRISFRLYLASGGLSHDLYCADCGGTPSGNADTEFKRKDCGAPPSCEARSVVSCAAGLGCGGSCPTGAVCESALGECECFGECTTTGHCPVCPAHYGCLADPTSNYRCCVAVTD